MKLKQQRETNGDFGRRHREYEQEHYLSVRAAPSITACDKSETGRVQHDLNGHQRENEITPREKSDQTQREQDHRQIQHVLHRYRH